jgi:purine catabolism regulator
MALTLTDLLALPVLTRARPQVVHGEHLERREVRWVHTSEIYDIGPLLKGGEVLLTTGLGLVGASPEQVRSYAAGLAARGVTALCLELGRTFAATPQPLADAAKEHDLPLVVFHGVIPFIEVTETVHQLLITREVEGLRAAELVSAELTDSLLAGGGLPGLLRRVATLAGCPATLVSGEGRVVASSEEDGGRSKPGVHDPYSARRPVEVFGVEWGHLVLHGGHGRQRDIVLERGVVAVALELVHSGGLAPARRQAGRELLRDIARNRFGSVGELAARAAAVGLTPRPGQVLVAVCFGVDPGTSTRAAVNAATEAGRRVFGTALVADVDEDVLLAGATAAGTDTALRRVLGQLADAIDSELAATTGGHAVAVAAGPSVADVSGLVRSVREAREASALARRLGTGVRLLLAPDVGVHRLLSRLVGDPQLERFVDEQLGVLLEYDARHGADLVRSLDAYLGHGLSKTRTADALGVRRQTLYNRLERIQSLLGGLDLSQRERRTALDLALVAWRLRSSAATYETERRPLVGRIPAPRS